MVSVNFKLEETEKGLLSSICALKGSKQQDVLREMVLKWIEINRFILSDNGEQQGEIIIPKKDKNRGVK